MTETRKQPLFSAVRNEGRGSNDFLQKKSAGGEATPLDPDVFQEGSMTGDQLLPCEMISQTEFTTFSAFESDKVLREDLRDNVAFSERMSFNSRISNEAFINQNRILPYERKYTEDKRFPSNIPREGIERNDRILEFEVPHEELPFQRTFITQTSVREEFQLRDGMQMPERLSLYRMSNDKPVSQESLLHQSACNKLETFATPCLGEEFIEQGQLSAYHKLEAFLTNDFGEKFVGEGQTSANMTKEAERTQVTATQSDVDFLSDPNIQSEVTIVKTNQRNPLISNDVIINESHVRLNDLKYTEEKPFASIVYQEGIGMSDNMQYQFEESYDTFESTLRAQGSALQDNSQQHAMPHAAVEKLGTCAFNERCVHQIDAPQREMARHADRQLVSTEHNVGLMPQDHLLHLDAAPFQEGRFNCLSCNQKFMSKILLQKHEQIHKFKKSFICYICCTFFAENTDLLGHIMTHKGEGPLPRTEYDKGFSTNQSLQRYQSTHADECPYKCDSCDYASARSTGLRTHQ